MFKERGLLILVVFLLLQAPLAVFFSKQGSFDELKGKIVISELALVAIFVLSVSLVRTPQKKQSIPLPKIPAEPMVRDESETMIKQNALLEQELNVVRKELQEVLKKSDVLENELKVRSNEVEVLRAEMSSELVSWLQRSVHETGLALFTQLEELQEVRRQHMIEMRALLKKEPAGPFERKTVLASIPRVTQDPLVLMALISIFAEKLSQSSEGKGDVKSLVRRKFFDELRTLKTLSCICLSVDTPSETTIPLPYLGEDVKKLVDFIRPKLIEKNSSFLLESQGERWFIQRLSKPFFDDVFLCFKR